MKRNYGKVPRGILVSAAMRALENEGYLERMSGRGMSCNFSLTKKDGRQERVAIRTTNDRDFTFTSWDYGKKWKPLDDVDLVVVAAVDDPRHPRKVEVYRFAREEVRERFDEAYRARKAAGIHKDGKCQMWVGLDAANRGWPKSAGAGLADIHSPVVTYPLGALIAEHGK